MHYIYILPVTLIIKGECRELIIGLHLFRSTIMLHSAFGQGGAEAAWSTTHAQVQVIYHILNIEPV